MISLILSVGRDTTLLALRNLLLAQSGYKVVSAHAHIDFVHKLFDVDFDAVIFCHSIPAADRQRMVALVRRYRPSAKVVALEDFADRGCSFADATVVGDSYDLIGVLDKMKSPLAHGRNQAA
jgi:DNA-binding NarL/FixJ family response regulator